MQNLHLYLQAHGNFGPAQASVDKLTASTNALGASFINAAIASERLDGSIDAAKFRAHANAVQYGSKVFRDAAASTGLFETSQIRANSQVEEFTKKLRNQKVGLGEFFRERNKMIKSAYEEQMRLRRMFVYQRGTDMYGNQMLDIAVPKNVPVEELKRWNNQLSYARAVTKSISKEMVNLGKNTQWAGRQLTVGFTVPAMIAGAFTGMQAYGVDKELTRIAKVYDTVATDAVSKEHELNQVRRESIALAREAASAYATSAEETLQLTAEFAATGLSGKELTETTAEALRVATLGEIEHQTALESTIALQSVFKMSNEELAESFNYMNAVENATSLQLADFAAAIPIAAAPVKAFGGDIRELGVLLTAMRENGIGAVEGANAIKASMQRLGRPSKQIRMEFQQLTGTDIVELVDNSASLIEVFQKINEVTRDLSGADQRKVYAGLFGSYQVSRMMAMTKGMGDLSDGVGQVSKAYELAQGSADDWAAAAESELAKMQQSASFRVQSAWQTLKVELAEIGEDFLEIGANILETVNGILNAFNRIPDGVKAMVTSIIGLVALAGPLIMLGGLATNLAGQFLNGIQAIVGLVTGVKSMDLVTRKTAAADAQAKIITDTYNKQAEATRNLKHEVIGLASAMDDSIRAQHMHVTNTLDNQVGVAEQAIRSRQMPQTRYPDYKQDAAGRWRKKGRFSTPPPDIQEWQKFNAEFDKTYESAGALVDAAEDAKVEIVALGNATDGTAQRTGRLSKTLAGASMALLLVGSSTGMFSSELMTLMGILTTVQIAASTGIFGKLSNRLMATKAGALSKTLFGGLIDGAKKAGPAISKFIFGPWGAGIALAVAGLGVLYNQLQKPLRRQQAISQSTGMWVDKLGVAETNVNKFAAGLSKAEEKANATLEAIQAMGDELADTDAGKALIESIENANYSERLLILQKEAIKLASNTDASDEDIEMAMRALMDQAGIAGSQVEKTINEVRASVLEGNSRTMAEVFANLTNEIRNSNLKLAREQVKELGGLFSSAFGSAETAAEARTYVGQLLRVFEEEAAKLEARIAEGGNIMDVERYKAELDKLNLTEEEIVRTIVERNNVIGAGITLQGLQNTIWYKALGLTEEQKEAEFERLVAQRDAQRESGNHFTSLSGMTNEAIRNQLGLNNAVEDESKARIKAARAAREQQKEMRTVYDEFLKSGWSDAYQGVMKNVMGEVTDRMQESFSDRADAARRAMDAEADAEDKSFEDRLDRSQRFYERRINQTKRAYDRQIEQIERILDKENELEARRQRIHDAEMRRIRRAQDARNTAIDLNVALASGQLDEAARILSDAQATEEEYAREDAQRAVEERQERREAALEARINRLERRRDAEVKGLEKAKKLKQEEIEAEREKAKEIQKINRDALDRRLTMEKRNLDAQIRYFQSWVPKSKKELEAWLKQVGGKHKEFGRELRQNSANWSEIIGNKYTKEMQIAANELKSKMDWAGLGATGSRKMLRGMADTFGMGIKEFRTWLGLKEPIKGRTKARKGAKAGANIGLNVEGGYHSGGLIGDGTFDRTGYTGSMSSRESLILAKKGEYMMNDRAVRHYGQGFMESVNSLKVPKNEKPHGGGGPLGFVQRTMEAALTTALGNAVRGKVESLGTGLFSAAGLTGGVFGDTSFTAEQLQNAAIIANVGSQMGMSRRDIMIGLMTAMQESMLRNINYGDRDSVGLFQQRPSQGWGTVKQIMNPEYAARKFFDALKSIPDRDAMSPTAAAQAVQRSAFPNAYAKWEDEARAIMAVLNAGFTTGRGGWQKPSRPGYGWSNSHDYLTPIGTPLYAASDGVIVESRAVTSGGNAGNGLYATPYRSYGETILMRTASGDLLRYAHLNPGGRLVRAGDRVRGGQTIGISGNTGNSSGPHVHFDVNGDYNARSWLVGKGISLRKGAEHIRWDNTLANLHHGETVLTKDLSVKFKQGVDNFANGGGNEYNVIIHSLPANASAEDVANIVIKKLKREEKNSGISRRVTD